ncbi:MAG: hypothetical protein MRJ68_12570 [Nitrospira sp.]|nr:hypothetical protein [Nitrospira sp.]
MAKTTQLDIPVSSVPEVQELAAKLAEARAEFGAAEAELDHLARILNPAPASSTHNAFVSELDVLKAQQQEPIARERYLLAKAQVLEMTPVYERTRAEALKRLTEARKKGRLPLLKQFAMALDAAAEIGETIRSFDEETVTLGGRAVEHPFAQLIDEPPYRPVGEASRIRRMVDELS